MPVLRTANIQLTVRASAGIWRKILASPPKKATIMPMKRNPPIALKFFLVCRTYADAAKKVSAVDPSASMIGSAPLKASTIDNMGPNVTPIKPVRAKHQAIPLLLFLFFSTIQRSPKYGSNIHNPIYGTLSNIEIPAIRALKPIVAPNNI